VKLAEGTAFILPVLISGIFCLTQSAGSLYSYNSSSIQVNYDSSGNLILTNLKKKELDRVKNNRIVVDELTFSLNSEEKNTGCKVSNDSVKYYQEIKKASLKHKLPLGLIVAVIKAESGFRKNAVSSKGACGLMQLMPKTAEELGVKDMFDPEENINAGTKYLKWLDKRYNGDYIKMLAAYNAGISRVNNWQNIEETRKYVKRVMRYWNEYQKEID
jgi:hypothetical protein